MVKGENWGRKHGGGKLGEGAPTTRCFIHCHSIKASLSDSQRGLGVIQPGRETLRVHMRDCVNDQAVAEQPLAGSLHKCTRPTLGNTSARSTRRQTRACCHPSHSNDAALNQNQISWTVCHANELGMIPCSSMRPLHCPLPHTSQPLHMPSAIIIFKDMPSFVKIKATNGTSLSTRQQPNTSSVNKPPKIFYTNTILSTLYFVIVHWITFGYYTMDSSPAQQRSHEQIFLSHLYNSTKTCFKLQEYQCHKQRYHLQTNKSSKEKQEKKTRPAKSTQIRSSNSLSAIKAISLAHLASKLSIQITAQREKDLKKKNSSKFGIPHLRFGRKLGKFTLIYENCCNKEIQKMSTRVFPTVPFMSYPREIEYAKLMQLQANDSFWNNGLFPNQNAWNSTWDLRRHQLCWVVRRKKKSTSKPVDASWFIYCNNLNKKTNKPTHISHYSITGSPLPDNGHQSSSTSSIYSNS
ncbi:hypothetical protein VP01_121g1 [Puccinia sorghi]|uniref:Uncharacterized protein n=1 Tax=Puccinia sorghi TaxID=27349 RepID=A0A0L6VQ31_9BASI|nr:hypothetical protein VP01_121g1 [Puccinia sorghi]